MKRTALLVASLLVAALVACSKEASAPRPTSKPGDEPIPPPSMTADELKSAKPAEGTAFYDLSFANALGKAKAENKLVMLDFYTTWCGPCKVLDKETFQHKLVMPWLVEKTIALKVDAEKDPALKKRFGVNQYPTIVFVTPDGKHAGHVTGQMAPKSWCKQAAKILGTTLPPFPPDPTPTQPADGATQPADSTTQPADGETAPATATTAPTTQPQPETAPAIP